MLLVCFLQAPEIVFNLHESFDFETPVARYCSRGELVSDCRHELHEPSAHLEIGGVQPPVAVT